MIFLFALTALRVIGKGIIHFKLVIIEKYHFLCSLDQHNSFVKVCLNDMYNIFA